MHQMVLLGDVDRVEARFICLETMLVLAQERCMVGAVHCVGLEVILDAPDGTPR